MLGEPFHRSLLAANKSPMTVKAYLEAIRLFDRIAADNGMPREVTNLLREHVEAFIADVLAHWKPDRVQSLSSGRTRGVTSAPG